MEKIFLLLLFVQLSISSSNAQWVIQYTTGSDCILNAIQFTDENTGYVVGQDMGFGGFHGKIYKTTNCGLNWLDLPLPIQMNNFIYNLYFFNSNMGFVSGHFNRIFKTTNGGISWDSSVAPGTYESQCYNTMRFFNEQTGYIAGRYGYTAKTTNSGVNWVQLDTAYAELMDIYFFDINTGFLCDVYSGVYKTTNGCQSWIYKDVYDSTSNHFDYAFAKIKFINNNTGYMVGGRAQPDYGAIFKTTDGGNNWKSIFITPGNQLYSLEIVNNSTIYVGSNRKKIYKSTDNGISWGEQSLPVYWTFTYSIVFTNPNTGFACNGNTILKTTNGGVFINNISSEIPKEYNLYQNYPNPFNPSTNIKYQIANNRFVTLKVFDLLGREVTILVNEFQKPGTYEVSFNGSNLASGIFFYKLIADGKTLDTKKMIVVK